jgi:hypothetical protein
MMNKISLVFATMLVLTVAAFPQTTNKDVVQQPVTQQPSVDRPFVLKTNLRLHSLHLNIANVAADSSCCQNACDDSYRFCLAGCSGSNTPFACQDQCLADYNDCIKSVE